MFVSDSVSGTTTAGFGPRDPRRSAARVRPPSTFTRTSRADGEEKAWHQRTLLKLCRWGAEQLPLLSGIYGHLLRAIKVALSAVI